MSPRPHRNAFYRVYAGFWLRVAATLLDNVFLALAVAPFWVVLDHAGAMGQPYSRAAFDAVEYFLVLPVLTLVFWVLKQATPGKLVVHARIVDADTGLDPSLLQWVVRYLGYFVSTVFLGLGFLWVAIDARKQGWHDKLAGTVVVCD